MEVCRTHLLICEDSALGPPTFLVALTALVLAMGSMPARVKWKALPQMCADKDGRCLSTLVGCFTRHAVVNLGGRLSLGLAGPSLGVLVVERLVQGYGMAPFALFVVICFVLSLKE